VGRDLYQEAGSGLYLAGQTHASECPVVAEGSDGTFSSTGPSEGLDSQALTSAGPGKTPTWEYISSSNWSPESDKSFENDVNNVQIGSYTSEGNLYTSIKDQLISDGKSAIVPSVHGEYVAVYCVEAPEVRFEEIISIKTNGRLKIEHEIDPEFMFICEPDSIKAISYTTTEPALCGVKIKENKLIITFSGNTAEEVTVKLSGIRKGFANVRFEKKTEEQANHNNNFWGQAKI